jgi:hypothetical protein
MPTADVADRTGRRRRADRPGSSTTAEVVSLCGDSYRVKDQELPRPASAANDDQ